MKKPPKHYTPEKNVAILRRHLVQRVPISDLCDELELQPTVFYRWQKEFLENGAAAFQRTGRTNHQPEQERIAALPWGVPASWYARDGGPGPLAFGKARLTRRRAGRRWLFCREECKQRDSNHAKDHDVLGAILPVHPVRHGLRRHDCHREPMGKA